jgi:hypothetical protein
MAATGTDTLYRTLVRLVSIDAHTVWLLIPASNFDKPIPFSLDDVHIPRWLLGKEPSYRFFANVPILAEHVRQVTLWNCENDPRTVAEQLADTEESS